MIQIVLRKLLEMETKKGLKCDLRQFFEDNSIKSLEILGRYSVRAIKLNCL